MLEPPQAQVIDTNLLGDHMTDRCLRLLAVAALLSIAACGGSDVTGVADSNNNGGSTPPAAPSFAGDVNSIFVAKGCTSGSCHGGGQGGMTLSGSASADYAAIVNVPATADPSFLRVKPDDAQNSYLVMKIEGRAGSRMPKGGSPLSDLEITTIRNWIDSGAPQN